MAEKEYIEREAARKYILDEYPLLQRDRLMRTIDDIPAADARPVVKACWIHMPSDGKFRDTCVCSACKKSPPIESWIVQRFNACPYCFADMREERS